MKTNIRIETNVIIAAKLLCQIDATAEARAARDLSSLFSLGR